MVNIAPRGTAILDDVAGSGGLNVAGSIGGLRVSSVSQLAVTSRIYADFRSTAKGTLGLFVPAVVRAGGLRRGVLPQLSNTAAGYRTNIGFFNPNPEQVTLRLELRDGAGTLVGQNTLTLGPLSQQQNAIGVYFPGVDLLSSANLTMSFDAAAPILGYASVNDNVSADPSFIAAQPDSGGATN